MGIAKMLSITFYFFFFRGVLLERYFRIWHAPIIYTYIMMHPVCTTQGDQRESPCPSVLPLKSLAPALVWFKYKPACAHWNPWSLPGTGQQFQEQIRAGSINGKCWSRDLRALLGGTWHSALGGSRAQQMQV